MDAKHLVVAFRQTFQEVEFLRVQRQGFEIENEVFPSAIVQNNVIPSQWYAVTSNDAILLPICLQITVFADSEAITW